MFKAPGWKVAKKGGALSPRTWRKEVPTLPCGRRQAKRGRPQGKWFLTVCWARRCGRSLSCLSIPRGWASGLTEGFLGVGKKRAS